MFTFYQVYNPTLSKRQHLRSDVRLEVNNSNNNITHLSALFLEQPGQLQDRVPSKGLRERD